MAAILSLEPMLHALPSIPAGVEKQSQDELVDSASSSDQQSLAARLQRLWQERGDFSKLSVEKLQSESEQEQQEAIDDEELKKTRSDQGGDNGPDGEVEQKEAAEEESMTQEQLWDLKLGILQGLDLARSDITSALDLLQLLLNPLNALSPAVPEEALALPSGSMSSTLLHTPLPQPAEGIHIRNTALALATKSKAVDTASDLLRNASKRLDRTTSKSQSEWTDLLRLKRSAQWKIEARPAQVPPHAAPSLAPFLPNIPIEKMARDLCIFCGIEESGYRWRQAGLVRLNNNLSAEKGKSKEKLSIPERLEGRRRMCMKVSFLGLTQEESKYRPTVEAPHEDDMHSALMQVQEELFEEEIFAELIREARDQPHGIIATRNSLEIRQEDAFKLTINMEDIEDLRPTDNASNSSSPSVTDTFAHLLLLVARLQMIQIYRRRRQAKATSTSDASSTGSSVNISNALRQLVLYYRHSSKLSELLTNCVQALRRSRIFGDDVDLDFVRCLNSPDTILRSAMSGSLNLQGCACLSMASQTLNLTFSGPSSIVVHLPTRNLPIRNIEDFVAILKRIIQAAILKELEILLRSIISEGPDTAHWEVLPTPKAVGKRTPALARKRAKDAVEEAEVEAFISILPSVAIEMSTAFEVKITLQAQVSARGSQSVNRKTILEYSSTGQLGQDGTELHEWLRNSIGQL